MRDGPLAALFRSSTGDGGGESEHRPEREEGATQEASPSRPSASERVHATRTAEPARVRSAEERLAQVFSADIPENIMDRFAAGEQPGLAGAATVHQPVIRVVGVGGAGVNAVNRMVEAGLDGIEFVAVNTDVQSLEGSGAHASLHIGGSITRGLGSGSDSDVGRQAAMEDYDRLKSKLKGSDMVFVTAGAGGGTGTGAAPVLARLAREVGALCVGIVTKPFTFEGSRRKAQGEAGVEALRREVDTLIVIPNARLLTVLDRQTSMVEAFRVADDVLRQGVQGISDLVTLPGLINLDFADVRTIMTEAGTALLGIGMGVGERRAVDAAEHAVSSPLLETSVEGARSILLSVTGGTDLSLWEVNEAAKAVADAAHPEANIIFGAMVDEKVTDQVWVTVVATGYGDRQPTDASGGERQAGANGAPKDELGRAAVPKRIRAPETERSHEPTRAGHGDEAPERPQAPPDKAGTIPPAQADREARVGRLAKPDDLPSVDELDVPEFIPRR